MKLPWHEGDFQVREGAKHICGRVLEHIVVTASRPEFSCHPLNHLYLVFGDGTYYEFYTNGNLGWELPIVAQERKIGRMLGKRLAAVLIGHIDVEGTSALRLVVEDGPPAGGNECEPLRSRERAQAGGQV